MLQAGWALVLLWSGSFDSVVLYASVGLAIFLRVRPGLLEGAHTMDPEMHHGDMGKMTPNAGAPGHDIDHSDHH